MENKSDVQVGLSRPLITNSDAPLKSRIDFLDALRVFAFSSVLVGHKFYNDLGAFALDPANHKTLRMVAEFVMPLCEGGAAGVVVFFLISGYIITHVLQRESAGVFAFRRLFRIYPLYMFAVLMETALATLVQGSSAPPVEMMLPRLLLVGDFFDTPYALAGVEWSLRVEVLFYALMAVLKAVGLFKRPTWTVVALTLTTALLYTVKPFPSFAGWSDGYLTLYGPFLFLGSAIYWFEKRRISARAFVAFAAYILCAYLVVEPKLHPNWKETNAVVLGIALFLVVWLKREHVRGNALIVQLSNLTFAVYLFHNWIWGYLELVVRWLNLSLVPGSCQMVILLLTFSWIMYNTVEKAGIRLGRVILSRAQQLGSRWFSGVVEVREKTTNSA
jgi:peptidoglycan/LPS O-acetylase OafA/YrhL